MPAGGSGCASFSVTVAHPLSAHLLDGSIRTLLLARTHTVVLDPDRVASAATRPTRDVDVDKFEDELAQLGFVMSLDLAMTMRRLPHQAIHELRTWIAATLAKALGAHRPHVPLFRGFRRRAATPASLYLRRMLTWLATRPSSRARGAGRSSRSARSIRAATSCVARAGTAAAFAGCPICHRRVAVGEPFVAAGADRRAGDPPRRRAPPAPPRASISSARRAAGSSSWSAGRAPLSPDDRAEIEIVIDAIGPAHGRSGCRRGSRSRRRWRSSIARLWMVAPDRTAMVNATRAHLATATDVLRVAVVLLGGNPELVEPMRLRSIGRGLRRAVLEALDRLPAEQVVEDMWRRRGLWKRVGERLHPYEYAARLPVATLAFAAVRQTRLDAATFGAAVRDEARGVATVRIADDRARVTPWASPVEDRLRAGDAARRRRAARPAPRRAAAPRRSPGPGRAGAPARRARRRDRRGRGRGRRAARPACCSGSRRTSRAAPSRGRAACSSRAARCSRRGARRIAARRCAATRSARSSRSLRAELVSRAATPAQLRARGDRSRARRSARADRRARAVATRDRVAARQRGRARRRRRRTGAAVPALGGAAGTRVDLDLSVAMFDADWRHVATCDVANLVVGDRVAVHSGDLTSAPPPPAPREFVDLDLEPLRATRRAPRRHGACSATTPSRSIG